jgi:hypothetical protein
VKGTHDVGFRSSKDHSNTVPRQIQSLDHLDRPGSLLAHQTQDLVELRFLVLLVVGELYDKVGPPVIGKEQGRSVFAYAG